MLKPNEIITAAEVAAYVLSKITIKNVTGEPRSPEQIALIVDLINTAVDAMLDGEEPDEPKGINEPKTDETKIPEIRVIPFSEIHEQLEKMFGGEK